MSRGVVKKPRERLMRLGRDSQTGPLETALYEKLDAYFEALEGRPPLPLYRLVVEAVERPLLIYALERCSYNQLEAAKLLGIHRNSLRKKLLDAGLFTTVIMEKSK